MSQGFGREVPRPHVQVSHRGVAKYLVVIPAAEGAVAKLFLENRKQVAELDAGTEEVSSMTKGLQPRPGADGPEWDGALSGHSAKERAAADIYTLAL